MEVLEEHPKTRDTKGAHVLNHNCIFFRKLVQFKIKRANFVLKRGGCNLSCGPNSITLSVFYGKYVELLLHLDQDLVALPSVKEHYIFSKIMHRFPQGLSSLPHNLCRNRPFILVGKLADLPSKMIKSFLGGVGV